MNNIAICFLCLLIIPEIAATESDLATVCKDFRTNLEKPVSKESQKQTTAFNKGLLWKVESPQGKTNYLFGTMHSQDKAVSSIPPLVRGAVLQSKLLIMETVPNQAANQAFLELMSFKEGQQLDHLLGNVLFSELIKQIKDYGIEKEQLKLIKPWAAFSIIGRPKPIEAPSLESNLYQIARQNKLDIRSLETMEEILSALDNLSIEDQLIILKDTICNHEQILHDTEYLTALYLEGNLAGIMAYNKQAHYDEAVFNRFMQNILYERNIRMLKRIENEFTKGGAFVAVGASHLADEKGLLNQLKFKGFTISLIY